MEKQNKLAQYLELRIKLRNLQKTTPSKINTSVSREEEIIYDQMSSLYFAMTDEERTFVLVDNPQIRSQIN